jgi:hypothetical protein
MVCQAAAVVLSVKVDQDTELLAHVGDERGDVDQRLDVGDASGGVGDDGAAVPA